MRLGFSKSGLAKGRRTMTMGNNKEWDNKLSSPDTLISVNELVLACASRCSVQVGGDLVLLDGSRPAARTGGLVPGLGLTLGGHPV